MSDAKFDAFLFYRSYRESLNGMTQKDQLATLLAIIDYALYGIEPELKGKMPAAMRVHRLGHWVTNFYSRKLQHSPAM